MKDLAKAEYSKDDVTITTTAEKAIISIKVNGVRKGQHLLVKAWGQLVTGADTTAVAPKLKEGTLTSGTLITETVEETIKAAAGSIEPYFIMATTNAFQDDPSYVFTLKQTDATGNGTVKQAAIMVRRIG